MKKCLRCTKPSSLHVTEIKEGNSFSLHLCDTCAKDYLSTVDAGSLPDDVSEPLLIGSASGDEVLPHGDDPSSKVCPHCEISFKQFRSHGRLGCPHDYEEFHDELMPLLESIHGDTQHVGKFPPMVSDKSRRQYELVRLKNELKAAITDEAYEEAAKLRDKINEIEGDTVESGDSS